MGLTLHYDIWNVDKTDFADWNGSLKIRSNPLDPFHPWPQNPKNQGLILAKMIPTTIA
jgi:hypothetical protein